MSVSIVPLEGGELREVLSGRVAALSRDGHVGTRQQVGISQNRGPGRSADGDAAHRWALTTRAQQNYSSNQLLPGSPPCGRIFIWHNAVAMKNYPCSPRPEAS